MPVVPSEEVREHFERTGDLQELIHSIGQKRPSDEYLEVGLGMPLHLSYVLGRLGQERGRALGADTLASIPFYSLCRGLFLPLSSMAPERAAWLFGVQTPPPPDAAGREALVREFVKKPVGLSLVQKVSCLLGDPFRGRPSTFRRDSVLRLVMSMSLIARAALLDRLAVVGDVAVLLAENRPRPREELQLTAAEVLETLRLMEGETRNMKYDLLRSLLGRMGKMEAYFLGKLLLRRPGFGLDYQGALLGRVLAEEFGLPAETVAHAMSLTDAFHVAEELVREGAAGMRRIQLQPLVPVRPALAGGTADEIQHFPVWVERKYDGIRLMLHKSTDARGTVLCGAYTRSRGDWLELVPGLPASIRALPGHSLIVDGELFGTMLTAEGLRPATVYEVHAALQGERGMALNLKYAAFDLVYRDGQDLTHLPLAERRRHLEGLVLPLQGWPLPVPVTLSEGQMASNREDLNRLYHHFRAQGHEGIIAKDLGGPYLLSERDPTWRKRKPEVTLDLVLLGAMFAVTSKENVGTFGSYVIGARRPDGTFEEVGDVAGVDRVRDAEIQGEILREGLITGRRIERRSVTGTHTGVELRPSIVVTIKFEGITKEGREGTAGRLSLRSPKLAVIRADKAAAEADTVDSLEQLYLRQRVG